MSKSSKSYSAALKFQPVLETLRQTRPDAELAQVHGVHPVTMAKWKSHFLEQGPLFQDNQAVQGYRPRIAERDRTGCLVANAVPATD